MRNASGQQDENKRQQEPISRQYWKNKRTGIQATI